jgi:hypothetical protein
MAPLRTVFAIYRPTCIDIQLRQIGGAARLGVHDGIRHVRMFDADRVTDFMECDGIEIYCVTGVVSIGGPLFDAVETDFDGSKSVES